jgi:hypothetical protein
MPYAIEMRSGDDATGGQGITFDKIDINTTLDAKTFEMPKKK